MLRYFGVTHFSAAAISCWLHIISDGGGDEVGHDGGNATTTIITTTTASKSSNNNNSNNINKQKNLLFAFRFVVSSVLFESIFKT